jgi:hypothetical protein
MTDGVTTTSVTPHRARERRMTLATAAVGSGLTAKVDRSVSAASALPRGGRSSTWPLGPGTKASPPAMTNRMPPTACQTLVCDSPQGRPSTTEPAGRWSATVWYHGGTVTVVVRSGTR